MNKRKRHKAKLDRRKPKPKKISLEEWALARRSAIENDSAYQFDRAIITALKTSTDARDTYRKALALTGGIDHGDYWNRAMWELEKERGYGR